MSAGYLRKCSSNGRPKTAHPTREAAEAQRRSLIASGKWRSATSNTYFCGQCGGYHVGRIGATNRGKGRGSVKNLPRHLDTQ